MTNINIYGAGWCEDTQQTREHLDRLGVEYEYFDVDKDDQAKQFVVERNGGKQKTPTIDIAGTILVEPSDAELDVALRDKGMLQ